MASVFAGNSALNVAIAGASRGIGLGFVRHLLGDNRVTRLYASYRTPATAAELLQLARESGDRLVCVPVELTEETQVANWVEKMQQDCDRLHLVVNCAGILHDGADFQPEKSLRQIDEEGLLRYFQVNSLPSVFLAKHLMPLFRHGDRSVFASISAKVGSIGDNYLGGWYGYRASKAALNMLMKTTAIEYSRRCPQTLVALLHPGTTDTDLSAPFQRNVPPEKLFPVERTVTQLMGVIEGLTAEDSGRFFSWDGSQLPW